jgi:hypothetical protein
MIKMAYSLGLRRNKKSPCTLSSGVSSPSMLFKICFHTKFLGAELTTEQQLFAGGMQVYSRPIGGFFHILPLSTRGHGVRF